MPSSACDWSSDVCSSDRSEEHTSELQSRSDLVCRIIRSEENTSELQSRSDIVCRLLLEKKKNRSSLREFVGGPVPNEELGLIMDDPDLAAACGGGMSVKP